MHGYQRFIVYNQPNSKSWAQRQVCLLLTVKPVADMYYVQPDWSLLFLTNMQAGFHHKQGSSS